MAIVPMKKVLICGHRKNRRATLGYLQRQGVLEVTAEAEEPGLERPDLSSQKAAAERDAASISQALAVLADQVPEEAGLLAAFAGRKVLTAEEYETRTAGREAALEKTARILELSRKIGEDTALLPKLEQQMTALEPWKSFDLPLNCRGTRKTAMFIGSIPEPALPEELMRRLGEELPADEAVELSPVGSSEEQTSFYVICRKEAAEHVEEALKRIGFARAPLSDTVPSERIEALKRERELLLGEIETCKKEIGDLAKHRDELKFAMDDALARAGRFEAGANLGQTKHAFFLTGYVPADRADRLKAALETECGVFAELADPDEDEEVPVLLHNNGFAAPVESVVESYSMPGKGDPDPSTLVALFYYILFGLMLSDAAYGFIIAAACAYCLWKFKGMEPGTKKFLTMFMYSGIATIFWGVMFGSYFGDAVNVIATTFFDRPDIKLGPLWFEPVSLPMKMLVFSFVIGIVHLFTGLGAKLYVCLRAGQVKDAVYDVVFWYLLVGGSIVYLLTMDMVTGMMNLGFTLPAPLGTAAAIAAVIGAVGIILTSGRESKSWFKRILKGIYGVYGITSYLSDILSYSRLLALGLATSVISTVFNKLGSMMGKSVIGAVLFIVIFVVGHALNLAINALGAYVHTNRLQFVEFFGKFYDGGGRKFAPFSMNTKYYKVKEDI